MFTTRCTLLSALRFSVFIPSTMTALLFACDLHASAALAALFFQATGGALAQNSDPRCTITGQEEKIGRLIGIGTATVFVGMVPSMMLARMHQRDFVTVDHHEHPSWRRCVQLWRAQDRFIYLVGALLLAFLTLFNLAFLANVTEADGRKWFVCVVTAMGQTIFGVPCLMTLVMLTGAVLSRSSASLKSELRIYFHWDDDDFDEPNACQNTRKSRFARAPLSKWNSWGRKRQVRRQRRAERRQNASKQYNEEVQGSCSHATDDKFEMEEECEDSIPPSGPASTQWCFSLRGQGSTSLTSCCFAGTHQSDSTELVEWGTLSWISEPVKPRAL